MDLGLKGKKVIVTGGSRGLGRAALEIFAAEGADVAFFSRNPDQVAEAKASLETHGGQVFAEPFEMGDVEAYKAWLVKAAEAMGGVDIFIHNVSASGAGAGKDWNVTFNLDVMGAVAGCEALEPYLAASGAGSVILMASTAAIETFFAPNAFNALKAALMTYSKQLSQAWGPKGIRVNVITPGPTELSQRQGARRLSDSVSRRASAWLPACSAGRTAASSRWRCAARCSRPLKAASWSSTRATSPSARRRRRASPRTCATSSASPRSASRRSPAGTRASSARTQCSRRCSRWAPIRSAISSAAPSAASLSRGRSPDTRPKANGAR